MGKGAQRRAHQHPVTVMMGTALRTFAHPTQSATIRQNAFKQF